MKIKLSELLVVNPRPCPSYVLAECQLTPEERQEWELKHSQEAEAMRASRPSKEVDRANTEAYWKELNERTRSPHLDHQSKFYEYPKSE